MNEFIVRKEITIRATAEKVWDALTNPEKTKQYFFHCKVFSDWKPGSAITFKGRIFLIKKIEMTGKIIKVQPAKLLQYTLTNESDGAGSFSTVTDELTYKDGKTTLSVTDNVGQGEGAAERYNKSIKGWDKILQGLKKLVEEDQSV